jgi:cell surface protein SprA
VSRRFLYTLLFLEVLLCLHGAVFSQTEGGMQYPITPDNAGEGGVYGQNPSNVIEEVIYDEEKNQYIIITKVGDIEIGREVLSFEEYQEYKLRKEREKYWREKEEARKKGKESNSLIPQINLGNSNAFKGIFGSNVIDIRPQGTVELLLGGVFNRSDNPSIPERQRRTGNFDFKQNIQLNVTGKIGDKININTNFNTQEMFGQNNRLNLKYEGQEDDIIKIIEAGNVQLPLTGTLITGMSSLFGIKAGLQFGKLTVTSVFSQQQGTREEINVQGGAQIQKFEVSAADYEANKHYFLGEYFKQQYDESCKRIPLISSQVRITRIEVWVTNRINAVENVRNINATLGLGETSWPILTQPGTAGFPDNNNPGNPFKPSNWDQPSRSNVASSLFANAVGGQEIEYVNNARLLNPSEYTYNELLGYISLNQPLNTDEVLGVAYQYVGSDGILHQVGEFSTDLPAPATIMVKLLKSTQLNVRKPNWHWMMKNIYAIGGYQISNKDFVLNVLYRDVERNVLINVIPDPSAPQGVKETPLLRVFNLDRLNQNNDQQPDGFFDYIENITVNSQNGRIIFPVREPFGQFIGEKLGSPALRAKYAFDSLYTTIQQLAKLNTERNRFYLGGQYQSSNSSEIMLNAVNVAKGSVTVTAGGKLLQENIDYTVDYTLGRVKIINPGLMTSGVPIKVSLESNALFNQQTKRMVGTHLDYKFSKDFVMGATLMNLTERPFTQKINVGDEPISNTMIGLDGSFKKEAPFITRLVDKIPLINTKAPSNVSITAEYAQIIPGHNRVIGKEGISQIDDFEGAETNIDVRVFSMWRLGTVPHKQLNRFPFAEKINNLEAGYGRALLSWYNLDPIFFRQNNLTPKGIYDSKAERSNNYVREVKSVELFPNLQLPPGTQPNIPILDVAFYPAERGPYNFDYKSLTPNGKLNNPRNSFGSMMRRVETTDWDGANIDYIEFWLMDPFDKDLNQLKQWETNDPNATNLNLTDPNPGGDFLIQIGNMTEDFLQDGRLMFENGLPAGTNGLTTVKSVWGETPAQQLINQNFINDPDLRALQDVGLDGMNDQAEQNFYKKFVQNVGNFVTDPAALAEILADPSADNYRHYNGTAYDKGTPLDNDVLVPGNHIHERYKRYQLPENNSPAGNINDAQTQMPNSEDINNDNTLNQSESYFQYRVSLRPQNMNVGENFITDKVVRSTTVPDGTTKSVTWYQFRVPVRSPERETYGDITDWRSIRFMRFVLNGFPDDIHLRFARLELVRADWRRFPNQIYDEIGFLEPDQEENFNVTTVNIEENSQKQPFNYVLPPGVTREIDPSNPALQQLNEQSLVLDVNNLADGLARGVFKNANLDLRAYKQLEMFVHAESKPGQKDIVQGDLTVFIRLGTDPSENYYEYEIAVKPSVFGDQTPGNVWPDVNHMKIPLQKLPEVKRVRNQKNIAYSDLYREVQDDGSRIAVRGNPNLKDIKSIMIGVRNPHKKYNVYNKNDDATPVSAQVWVNELRVTDFFEKGGWAANTRISANLADLGTVNLALSYERFGFGAIDKKPLERARNNTLMFDFSGTFELAKFTPKKWGLTVPMFVGYSTTIANPQFNPVDPDIKFTDALNDLGDITGKTADQRRDSLRNVAQSVLTRRSINFTNVRKNRTNTQRLAMPWDIENWDITYAYTKTTLRNTTVEYDNTTTHRGILGYTYAPASKPWEPFKKSKSKFWKSKWTKLLKDFNFAYLPKQFVFRNDIQRDFNELKFRNNSTYELLILPSYRKNFIWNRTYDFAYAPFKSLNITFNALNNSRIDEPEGAIDTKEKKDSLRANFFRFGRTTNYTHNFNITYNLPLSKIPATDWITVNLTYGGSFNWATGQLLLNPTTDRLEKPWGNTISNSQTKNITGQLNMTMLYNKVPYLKNLNNKTPAKPPVKAAPGNMDKSKDGGKDGDKDKAEKDKAKPADDEPKFKIVNYVQESVMLKKDRVKTIKHKLKTENVKVKVVDETGTEVKGKVDVWDKNRIKFTPARDVKKAKFSIEGKIEKKGFDWGTIPRILAGIVTGIKSVSLNYTETNGTTLPGYINNSNMMGQDFNTNSPGFGFVFGEQFEGNALARRAAQGGWLTKDPTLNSFFMRSHTQNINASATIEPIKSLKIQLTATRQFTRGSQELYRYSEDTQDFDRQNYIENGNFTISYLPISTSFIGSDKEGKSPLFATLLENRTAISELLGNANQASSGYSSTHPLYRDGYNPSQQDVLMYAFLSAYNKRDPKTQKLNSMPAIPMPNWTITYDGLKNIGILKKLLKNIVISHGYKSTLSQSNFMKNQLWNENPNNPGFTADRDSNGNFVARYLVQNMSIMEAFSPLFNLDMTWKNSLTTKFEVKKTRNTGMNFMNNQLTEVSTWEWTFGMGYKIEKLRLPFIVAGKRLENALNLRLDIGIRDNVTTVRKVADELVAAQQTITAGQQNITIKFFADYAVTKNLNVRLYYDRIQNNPFVANQFKTANTNVGLSIRFTLAP